jgi:hypothetical protein
MKNTTSLIITRNIGANRGNPRLWIQGDVLSSCGWNKGDKFDPFFADGFIRFRRSPNGKRKVAGDHRGPILDTNSKKIHQSLGDDVEVVTINITFEDIWICAAVFTPSV